MMRSLRILQIAAAIVFLLIASHVRAQAQSPSHIAVSSIDGKTCRPLDMRGKKAAVLLFILHDCPIANSYVPEYNRIIRAFATQGFAFYTVYVDQDLLAAQARAHAKSFSIQCPGLLDPHQKLVKLTGVTISPEAAVVAPDGKILYRGRIDNLWASIAVRRSVATTHDLREALSAIAKGAAVLHASAPGIGCFIPSPS